MKIKNRILGEVFGTFIYDGFTLVGSKITFKNEEIEKYFKKQIKELTRSEFLDLISKKV